MNKMGKRCVRWEALISFLLQAPALENVSCQRETEQSPATPRPPRLPGAPSLPRIPEGTGLEPKNLGQAALPKPHLPCLHLLHRPGASSGGVSPASPQGPGCPSRPSGTNLGGHPRGSFGTRGSAGTRPCPWGIKAASQSLLDFVAPCLLKPRALGLSASAFQVSR